ncbi:MAG TPA: ATP-binding protein, partial [Gemmatimonadaceae bacterium]
MADGVPSVSETDSTLAFQRARVEALLDRLEAMAGGDKATQMPISDAHDELDAIAHGINVLADELRWTHARMTDAERLRAAELLRAKERAERASEAKSIFLRTASHEIRTPIAAILGIADLLAHSNPSTDEQTDLVDRLRANSRALLSLVGNVLDLSRLDADKIALTLEPVSPVELTREVVKSLDADARKKGIVVRIDSDVPSSLTIETDRLRLRQILVNVLVNAVKFTPRGEILISVQSHMVDDQRRVTIDVTDSGIGIDAGQRHYLFEPFGQADPTIARVHGGTGLGLALSSRLAEQLGGSLVLRWSEPGKGSTFRLTLDGSKAATSPAQPHAPVVLERSTSPRGVLDGVRVLLADDNPDLQLAIGRTLRLDGATVAYAHDGNEAVTMAKTGLFDVVLMD